MAARSWIILLLFCGACSWEYHRSHYRYPFLNPQPGDYYFTGDSTSYNDTVRCNRQKYFISDGDWLHMTAYQCDDKWRIDTGFDAKGRIYLIRKHHEARTATYLYDTSFTVYFDKDERPLKHYISINKPDTAYEYWQYYDEDGKVEAQKRPVIYTILSD